MYEQDVIRLVVTIRKRFRYINRDTGLTDADKKQIKDFYLQHMIAPRARKLLEKHFPNEFNITNPRSASPDRNNTPDR